MPGVHRWCVVREEGLCAHTNTGAEELIKHHEIVGLYGGIGGVGKDEKTGDKTSLLHV